MTVRLKSIVLPPEHGSWGFLLEPIVLGLLIAPSWASMALALGVTAAFLTRQPIKITLLDWLRRKRYARTRAAEKAALLLALVSLVGFVVVVALKGIKPLLPFALALPLAVIVFVNYTRNSGRDLLPELAGSAAIALSAPGLALAGGTSWTLAMMLWVILMARNIPSILYIRARLRLDKDHPGSPLPARIAQLVALLVIGLLVVSGEAPALALLGIGILAARALWGLSPYRQRVRVVVIGVMEMIYGLLLVLLTAAGYSQGW